MVNMPKNDGLAEVVCNNNLYQMIINHYKGEPEIWDEYKTYDEARAERDRWYHGMLGEKRDEI